MAMERCFQMCTVSGSPRFTSTTNNNNIFKPTTITTSFFSHTFNCTCKSTPLILCKSSLNQVEVVTECTWTELVVASEMPVLVEFWAPWCGPCQVIGPVVDELAKEYTDKALCFKINTDDCPNIASQYGIRSIPTVLIFKDAEKKESVIGVVSKSTLSATLDKYVD